MRGLSERLLKHSDLLRRGRGHRRRRDDGRAAAGGAARPPDHREHHGRARDPGRRRCTSERSLDFASFPSLLLLTTLFRLAINVSVTRLVLLHGDAGGVIHAFGSFVVGGNLVVGLVVFLILVVIQFAVITNGAGPRRRGRRALHPRRDARQADGDRRRPQRRPDHRRGGADAALRDLARGRLLRRDGRRLEVRQGRRDRRRRHRRRQPARRHGGRRPPAGPARSARRSSTYSLLTIGDGLAAQIPALLISTATGILVTRSASTADLGTRDRRPAASASRGPR